MNENQENSEMRPRLIEPQARHYMADVLYKCTQTRAKIYTNVLNISVGVLFLGVSAAILYFSYRNRPTSQEKYDKEMKDQAYILTKIRQYKEERQNIHRNSLITGLPLTQSG